MGDVCISRISKTRRGRNALFCGDEFLFSVDDETLLVFNIQEGSSLTTEELFLLKDASDMRKAKDSALRYLALRAYGERELYNKLCLKYDEPTAAAAVGDMCALGLLDDETFATEKAKGMSERGKSSGEIRRKLRALGVEDAVVQRAVLDAATDDVNTAQRIVQKMYTDKLRKGQRQNVMAALARRGFRHADIVRAIELVAQELEIQQPLEDV